MTKKTSQQLRHIIFIWHLSYLSLKKATLIQRATLLQSCEIHKIELNYAKFSEIMQNPAESAIEMLGLHSF